VTSVNYINTSTVAIGKPELQVGKASHCGSMQQYLINLCVYEQTRSP